MKKLLTFILVLAMVMSVSSFAMAETNFSVSSDTELANALSNALNGDTITITGDISCSSSTSFDITKDITIKGNGTMPTLNNVKLQVGAGSSSVTIQELKFAGDSAIKCNSNDLDVITVKNCVADVSTNEWGFIVLGNDSEGYAEKVIITGNSFCVDGATSAAAIIGWHKIMNGSQISNNTFGSSDKPFKDVEAVVKLLNFDADATVTISNNTIYGDNSDGKFYAFWLHQNNSRGNTYYANLDSNALTINPEGSTPAQIVAVEVNAYNNLPGHANVNITNSTINGKNVAIDNIDIRFYGSSTAEPGCAVDSYVGIDLEFDTVGKVVSGLLHSASTTTGADSIVADGIEIKTDDAGNVIVGEYDPNPPAPAPAPKSDRSGISITYNGGNSFSTSNPSVPTGVEIDNVPVSFTGNGSSFTVGCIDPNAEWVTVRWNSTSVTVNFKPDANVVCAEVAIPKTGDMPVWAAVAQFFGF